MRKATQTLWLQKETKTQPAITVTCTFNYSPATLGSREEPPEDEEIEILDVKIEDGTLADFLYYVTDLNAIEFLTEKISETYEN